MKSTRPVDPRLRKLPRGISITTSTSGGSLFILRNISPASIESGLDAYPVNQVEARRRRCGAIDAHGGGEAARRERPVDRDRELAPAAGDHFGLGRESPVVFDGPRVRIARVYKRPDVRSRRIGARRA